METFVGVAAIVLVVGFIAWRVIESNRKNRTKPTGPGRRPRIDEDVDGQFRRK